MAAASADSAAAMTRRSALSRSIFPSLRASSSPRARDRLRALEFLGARARELLPERSGGERVLPRRTQRRRRSRLARCARANRLFRLGDALRVGVALLLQNRARARLRSQAARRARRQCAAEGRWRVPKRVKFCRVLSTRFRSCVAWTTSSSLSSPLVEPRKEERSAGLKSSVGTRLLFPKQFRFVRNRRGETSFPAIPSCAVVAATMASSRRASRSVAAAPPPSERLFRARGTEKARSARFASLGASARSSNAPLVALIFSAVVADRAPAQLVVLRAQVLDRARARRQLQMRGRVFFIVFRRAFRVCRFITSRAFRRALRSFLRHQTSFDVVRGVLLGRPDGRPLRSGRVAFAFAFAARKLEIGVFPLRALEARPGAPAPRAATRRVARPRASPRSRRCRIATSSPRRSRRGASRRPTRASRRPS